MEGNRADKFFVMKKSTPTCCESVPMSTLGCPYDNLGRVECLRCSAPLGAACVASLTKNLNNVTLGVQLVHRVFTHGDMGDMA
jgi:hypothetical protein